VTLTEQGIIKIEKILGIENLFSPESAEMTPYLDNALRAWSVYERDRDYVVSDKREIIIVDEFTGRLMYGRRFSEGLHQAIEAKEGVKVQRESFTYATITFQNFFRMYDTLSGMTGTALTESEEFFKIYNLEVVPLPTHIEYQASQKKLVEQKDKFMDGTPINVYVDLKTQRKYFRRLDYPDLVYKTRESKFKAVVDEIAKVHETGRPILVGTIAIETSEMLSRMLDRKGVKHQVLNAKQHEREAYVIAQAGQPGLVTIATNMAGRGVDILLGGNPEGLAREVFRKAGRDLTDVPREEWQASLAQAEADMAEARKQVLALGGLHVIGTERHEARRIDNQLRGRCARQGDPGSTRFYVSLEDELMQRFGGERVKDMMTRLKLEDDVPLEYGILSKSIEQAQEKVEGYNFDLRKHVIQYDDVINKQREVIYHQRRTILEKDDLRDVVMEMVNQEIEDIVDEHTEGDATENWDLLGLTNEVRVIVPLPKDFDVKHWTKGVRDEIVKELQAMAEQRYGSGLDDFAGVVRTQLMMSGVTFGTMRESRDTLLRAIYANAKRNLGEALTPELEEMPLNNIPADYRNAMNQSFVDGVRLFRDRSILIQSVDQFWVRHLTDLDELREGIGLRAYAQRDPLVAYRTEASNTYSDLLDSIRENVSQRIFNVQFNTGSQPAPRRQQPAQQAAQLQRAPVRSMPLKATGGGEAAKLAPVRVDAKGKVGRNDVCPFCNSGKKVKHCTCEGARHFRGET
jgi:preprotein translocase subunit SecA